MTSDARESPAFPELNRKLLLLATMAGVVLIALSVVTSEILRWDGIWPSVFLEVGATVALAGLLFALERALVRQVREETAASEERIESRAAELEGRIESRLANLAEQVQEVTARRQRGQDEAIRALGENLSRESVLAALGEAAKLDALGYPFRVRAAYPRDGLRLEVREYQTEPGAIGGETRNELGVTLWFPHTGHIKGRAEGFRAGSLMLMWGEEEPVAELADRIIQTLQREGLYPDPSVFTPDFAFRELQRSLDVAIRSRRGDPPRLQGALIEAFDEQWFITSAGLENPYRGTHLQLDDLQSRGGSSPPTPEYVDEDLWTLLVSLAQDVHRGRS